jgi:hypothetical protein
MTTELRLDAAFSVRKMKRTNEGFLDIYGVASRRGVLSYENGDRLEYVGDDALQSMLETLEGAPVTLEHPPSGKVTPETARQLQRGTVIKAAFHKPSGEVRVRLRITDAEAIEEILEGGVRELSPGYKVTSDETPGEDPDHGEYDAVQVARLVNHLALTEAGRAGPDAALRVDSLTGTIMDQNEEQDGTEPEKLDADDEPKDEPTQDADDEEKQDASDRFDALEAKMDMVLDMLMPDQKEDEDDDPDSRQDSNDMTQEKLDWAKDRRRIFDAGEKLDLQLDEDEPDNMVLKRQVVDAATDMTLDSKSDDYVDAAFDLTVQRLDSDDDSAAPDMFERASKSNRQRQDSADDDSRLEDSRRAWADAPQTDTQ